MSRKCLALVLLAVLMLGTACGMILSEEEKLVSGAWEKLALTAVPDEVYGTLFQQRTTLCSAGPISFVGVAVPHLVKNLLGTTKPILMIPACFLGGSVFCLFCDLFVFF